MKPCGLSTKTFSKLRFFCLLTAGSKGGGADFVINEAPGDESAYRVDSDQRGRERDNDGYRRASAAGELPRLAVHEPEYRQREKEHERVVIPRSREVELHEAEKRAAHSAAGAGKPCQPVYRAAGQKKPEREQRRGSDVDKQQLYRSVALCNILFHTGIIPRSALAVNMRYYA